MKSLEIPRAVRNRKDAGIKRVIRLGNLQYADDNSLLANHLLNHDLSPKNYSA